MTSKRFSRLAFILSGAAIISYSAAAHAGFEWKGPLEAPAPQAAAPAPADTGSMGDLAPVGAEGAAAAASAPQAAAPAAMPVAAPVAPAPAGAAGDTLAGFAKDVPLVMALQQIVPPGYQYSFASGVDAGTSVSWEGGKPWQSVLSDMLGSHGLGYTLQNNTVVVGPSQAPASKEASAAPAPAAAPAPDSMMTPMPSDSAAAAPANSSAPLNIVSPPPGESASNAPVAAPVAPAADANAAQTASAASAPKKEETVTIHRDKPKSLLERLGFVHHKSTTDTAAASSAPAPAPAAATAAAPAAPTPQSEKVASADMPVAPTPAASPPVMSDAPVATAQPAAAMTAVAPSGTWQGAKGATLRDVLKAWSDKAGVDLYWSIDYDYRLSEDVGISGSYDEAVGNLLDKFASVRPQPYGQLHQGGNGPRVLVIKSYDLTP